MPDHSEPSALTVAVYSPVPWEHVCSAIRVIEPQTMAGMKVIKGNDWKEGKTQVYPERLASADLVVIQRDFPIFSDEYKRVISTAHTLNKPVVYELDDLLIDLSPDHPDVLHFLKSRPALIEAAIDADAITASSQALCDQLRNFNLNTYLLPNFLVDRFWDSIPRPHANQQAKPVIIGYLASHSHQPDLEMILPALEAILEQMGDKVELMVWGLRPPSPLLEKVNVKWTHPYLLDYSEFARYFIEQKFDIAIAPLQDNQFNRCKSALKFLEYSALGIAGVYSRLGPYEDIVVHAQNGFLASNLEEWVHFLTLLVENADLCEKMGQQAQETVKENWLLSQNSYRWFDVYKKIISGDGRLDFNRSVVMQNAFQKTRNWYENLADEYIVVKQQPAQPSIPIENRGHDLNEVKQQLEQTSTLLNSRDRELDEVKQQLIQTSTLLSSRDRESAEVKVKIRALTGKLKDYEAQLAAKDKYLHSLNTMLVEKDSSLQILQGQLSNISNSTGWKLLGVVYRIRLILFPRSSLRERILKSGIAALWVWRREGFRAMLIKSQQKLRHRQLPVLPSPSVLPVGVNAIVMPGAEIIFPSVSIVLCKPDCEIDAGVLREWLQKQTLPNCELVIWDLQTLQAKAMVPSEFSWTARDLLALCEGVTGKYVCFASTDLIKQPPTYLEQNLIALESEGLAFTVNVNTKVDRIKIRLEAGQLPGDKSQPFFRQIIHKDVLKEENTIDLGGWISHEEKEIGAIVGKVIYHTSVNPEKDFIIPYKTRITGAQLRMTGSRLAAQPLNKTTWTSIPFLNHPIDNILESIKSESDLPTMIVVMPFMAVGGAERVALDMMKCLKETVRFVVVTLEEHDPVLGTTIGAFREITPYVYPLRDFLMAHLYYSFFVYLINRFNPTTLYIANGATWIYDALSTLKTQYPEIKMANQVYDHQAGWINRYDLSLAKALDANIGVNEKICNAFIERGVPPERVYMIENGVNIREYDPSLYDGERCFTIRNQLGVPKDAKVVTFMARLHPQKRPVDFVELARRFQNDPSTIFLMIGDGQLAGMVDSEIKRIGLKNIIRRPFYRPSSDIFSITDVFVLPSEYEGMPMVILEAQAMGKPVLVTDVGNNKEILAKTHGGVLVSRIGDIAALQEGLHRLIEQPPDPAFLRQAILNYYSLDKMADKYKSALLNR